jgi:flagellar basal-body rod protein FlgB
MATSPVGALFNDSTYRSLELSLDATAKRHAAIASNIANINTPGYQRVDLDPTFQTAMKQALRDLDQKGTTANAALPTPSVSISPQQDIPRMDGNTVNLEKEMVNLLQNQSTFDFAAQMTAKNLRMIRTSITGKSA